MFKLGYLLLMAASSLLAQVHSYATSIPLHFGHKILLESLVCVSMSVCVCKRPLYLCICPGLCICVCADLSSGVCVRACACTALPLC